MQRKLTLDPDTLQIASFEATPVTAGTPGTVEAREAKVRCVWSAALNSCQGGTFHTCASFDFCLEG
jgi:hypothetical protein